MATCASILKCVTLELGGNNASIVCPDVDIANTAPALYSGQVCIATKSVYVRKGIYALMVEAMGNFAVTLKVGGDQEGVILGPIQNAMQFQSVKGSFEEGKGKDKGVREQGSFFPAPGSAVALSFALVSMIRSVCSYFLPDQGLLLPVLPETY